MQMYVQEWIWMQLLSLMNGFEKHSLREGENPEISNKYNKHVRKVKKFDYNKDLKFISDV